jgi:hypothetical protein
MDRQRKEKEEEEGWEEDDEDDHWKWGSDTFLFWSLCG